MQGSLQQPDAGSKEVLFLVLNFLSSVPLDAARQAVVELEAQALQAGLLPTRTDIFGKGLGWSIPPSCFTHP
jgi:hypothetical protein